MLAGLQQLRELNLGWCHTVGSEDVAALAALTRLTSLELARTRVRLRDAHSESADTVPCCLFDRALGCTRQGRIGTESCSTRSYLPCRWGRKQPGDAAAGGTFMLVLMNPRDE